MILLLFLALFSALFVGWGFPVRAMDLFDQSAIAITNDQRSFRHGDRQTTDFIGRNLVYKATWTAGEILNSWQMDPHRERVSSYVLRFDLDKHLMRSVLIRRSFDKKLVKSFVHTNDHDNSARARSKGPSVPVPALTEIEPSTYPRTSPPIRECLWSKAPTQKEEVELCT